MQVFLGLLGEGSPTECLFRKDLERLQLTPVNSPSEDQAPLPAKVVADAALRNMVMRAKCPAMTDMEFTKKHVQELAQRGR